MSEPLRDLIQWRNKAVIIACHLQDEKRTKAARLMFKAAEAFEEYLFDEFGEAYMVELLSLIREFELNVSQPHGGQVIPFRKGERP